MARPKLPDAQKRSVAMSIYLRPEVSDIACQLALKRGESLSSICNSVLERVFLHYKMRVSAPPCYGGEQPSTLGSLLPASGRTASGTRS